MHVARWPHPFDVEVGVADVACERVTASAGCHLQPLNAETVRVLGDAAGHAFVQLIVTIEQRHAAGGNRGVQ